ncbi:hypothetical protein M409DRAFT_54072 [Zasmidium cellare ATCC 36951]|uniref:Uncharacterized protein n=1 Tax=Zasmidium cellare ATCC 36951 TaxID=1080233 RepID=A0A6A6CLG2_ZASCE|nr:uncharacterized protein M409DRAFT_54072 [Zasmidium cellare ATCC 36951]KAF2167473.1 hypothetical protein M409DRAFT_54072 [Zasmidium cellare ATCC 36951]
MDLIHCNGVVSSLEISRTSGTNVLPLLSLTADMKLKVASANLKATHDKIRRLKRELAEAQEDDAKFQAQQNLDIAIQALADMNFDTSKDNDGEEDLVDTAMEMELFQESKLKAATKASEEEELLQSMRNLGLKSNRRTRDQQRRSGGIDKLKRYDPKKSGQDIARKKKDLTRAVTAAAAQGLEGMGKQAVEMHIPGVGIVMGKKTAPRLTDWS